MDEGDDANSTAPAGEPIARAARAQLRPRADDLVRLLTKNGIHAQCREESYVVEILVFAKDLAGAQALILDYRRSQIGDHEILRQCPGCRYPTEGLSRPLFCPECGHDLTAARDMAILNDEVEQDRSAHRPRSRSAHRWRRMQLAFAVMIVCFAAGPLAAAFVATGYFRAFFVALTLLLLGLAALQVVVALRGRERDTGSTGPSRWYPGSDHTGSGW